MQSKKEAIEIIKAKIENAINCNETYAVILIANKQSIKYSDRFGEEELRYDPTKKTVSYEDIKNSIDKNTDKHMKEMDEILEVLQLIASNTDGIKVLMKDTRAMLSHHSVKQVFMESQCNHIKGMYRDKTNGKTYLGNESDNRENFKYDKLFYFCPECGSKLR